MSNYRDYGNYNGERFQMRVNEVSVRGLFGGSGTITGTVLSGVVFSGNILTAPGKKAKPYTVTAVSVDGGSVRPDIGTTVRLEVQGIKKKDLTPGDVLLSDPSSGHSLLIDVYEYVGDEKDYFAEVFARYFSDYDVRRDGTVRAADGSLIKPDFLFYCGNEPRLAIFLRDSGEWRKKEVNYLQDTCREQGIGALTFIWNFQNKVEYVCERVGNELG